MTGPVGSDQLPLPTFVIIGAQKSATRWLRTNLGEHPDVFMADREMAFFSNRKRFEQLGLEWYRAQFDGWNNEPAVGEGTPAYMMLRHHPEAVAARIDASLDDARVVAILRNPIDRALSAMVHHVQRERLPADADLLQVVRSVPPEDDVLGLVAGGWYARSLEPFAARFRSRLLVLIHDDLATVPDQVYDRAVAHVGVAPGFVPSGLARVMYSNRSDADRTERPLGEEQRRDLWEFFREDVHRLEAMIDRDLSMWDPTIESTAMAPAG